MALAVGFVLLLPVLYVLSAGPALWLFYHGYASRETMDIVYAPLNWAGGYCEPFGDFTNWYGFHFVPARPGQ